jgi:D-glycero-D-manno-heptose 1,7-bisphosphate phosphatase
MARRAAFVDRDGTIIEERYYLADPAGALLAHNAAAGLRRLRQAGFALVVVTNQSGIARGLYSAAAFGAVQQQVEALLAAEGVVLDGVYHCPHHPDVTGPCDCRKPALGMYRSAAGALDLDLARSVYIGDRIKDVLPAIETGGTGILVRTGYGREQESAVPSDIAVVDDLLAAARLATHGEG